MRVGVTWEVGGSQEDPFIDTEGRVCQEAREAKAAGYETYLLCAAPRTLLLSYMDGFRGNQGRRQEAAIKQSKSEGTKVSESMAMKGGEDSVGHGGPERPGTHLPLGKAIPILLKSKDRVQGIWKGLCSLSW